MTTTTDPSIAYALRTKELSRMSSRDLGRVWRLTHPQTVWTAAPPEKWNRDELVNDILRVEFPHGDPLADRAALIAHVGLLCGADAATEPAFALSTSLPCGKCGAVRATVLVVVGWTETANVETRVCVDCID